MKLWLTFVPVLLASVPPSFAEGVPSELNFVVKEPKILRLDAERAKCPTTPTEWEAWRNDAIKELFVRSQTDQSVVSLENVILKAAEFDIFITNCATVLDNTALADSTSLVKNFRTFSRALSYFNKTDHQFGFNINDNDFLQRTKTQLEIPHLLQSQEFLLAVSDENKLLDAKKLIDDRNLMVEPDKKWQIAFYKSQFLTTPDCFSTFGRFFVYVPNHDGYEKWIQFGINTPGFMPDPSCSDKKSNNFSVVSVGPINSDGKSVTYSLDYWRNYQSDGSIVVKTRYESVNTTENCFLCHKTAPLGIHPEVEYDLDASGKLVERPKGSPSLFDDLNDKINGTYGQLSFDGLMEPLDYGPSIGPTNVVRDIAYVRACAKDESLSDASLTKIGGAMRCSSCHREGELGPLNFPQPLRSDAKSVQRQLAGYIMSGMMPPGNKLSQAERAALHKCLVNEYYDIEKETGILVNWLKGN
ncbi:cytochrome c [Azospirillum sp. TSA6c]|uniref:c-type cytochrome n=1 Tax=Azospirillum sp. TSA6c TaxID=709813 RepID=UPI0011B75D3E|nr:cytochrome c [Azospirillum sp. TSA6c]